MNLHRLPLSSILVTSNAVKWLALLL